MRWSLGFDFYPAVATILGSIWTGVRVAEGAGLENRYTGNGIVGSNPTLSVIITAISGERAATSSIRLGSLFAF